MLHRAFASLICAATVLGPAAALAQEDGGNLDLNAFRPAVDSRGYVTVNASQVLGHKDVSFGLVTNWGHQLVSFEAGNCGEGACQYEVANFFSPTLIGAFGLKVGPAELQFGASMPFHVMQGDRGPDFTGMPGDPRDDERFKFQGQGVGDLGLHFKTRFLSTSKAPVGLGLVASVYLPTSSEEGKWLGEDALTPQVVGVVDREFGDRFRVAATGGVRLRTGESAFIDDGSMLGPGLPGTMETVEAGTSIPFGVGAALALAPQKTDLVGEIIGDFALDGENYFPLEALAGLKLYLAKNSFLSFGGGVGFLPGQGGNPDYRAFLGIVFEPNIGDRDGDGLKDDVDQCPTDPEDFDGFEDEDGCPEPDNDRDGILDVDDQCPNDPEDKDGFEDEDGCPEGDQLDRDGDGILDHEDECPDDPEDKDGFEDEDGCPDLDNDQDGILDVDDLCPNDPEDKDSFEDEDGCPDPDNDNDRILDVDDACPRVDGETEEETAEVYNGTDDEDGCPDRGRVTVTDTKIEILDKIYFEFDSDVIREKSYPILDAIVATLQGNPDIRLVEIQGHTDERGSDSYNRELSDRRAKSVRRYLIEGGVDAGRLEAQGYGEDKPLDPRSNEEAWSKNRRVEFLIVERASE